MRLLPLPLPGQLTGQDVTLPGQLTGRDVTLLEKGRDSNFKIILIVSK
jgi:hypothetical protein